jgi:hypothetical protein
MMTDSTAPMTDAEWLATFRRLHLCDAEASGLAFPCNKEKIIALSSERAQLLEALAIPRNQTTHRVDGWYWDESLTGCFIAGQVDFRTFATVAVEFLAQQVETVTTCNVQTARAFTHRFGPELTGTLLDILAEGMANLRTEYRRVEKVTEDEETGEERIAYFRLDDTEADLEECPYVRCEPSDECASQITVMEFDFGHWEELEEEVQKRERAADDVRRRPIGIGVAG